MPIIEIEQLFKNLEAVGNVFSHTWFIILPTAFFYVFKFLWLDYVQKKYLTVITPNVLLELTPPKNIEKSPKNMESVFSGLSGALHTPTVYETYLDGEVDPRFSFEMESREGMVHFYVRTHKKFQQLTEAHIYAQYPDVIIREVDDYVNEVPAMVPNNEWNLYGMDYELAKPEPYPIRTYKYFQEDVTGKMIDPLSAIVETMGKIGPGQHIWLQYIVVPLRETWNVAEHKIIDEITGRAGKTEGIFSNLFSDIGDILGNIGSALFGTVEFGKEEEKKEEQPLEFRLTPVEKEILKAVEGNLGKNMFQVKMRFVYLGKNENFDKPNFISSIIGAIKQFNDMNLNSFKPNDKSKTYADYLWEKPRKRYRQRKLFRRYKERDPIGATVTLSTEEMATVFHMPDMSVVAPSVTYVEAKRGGAPANLPVE
jgi:hypothetical protein